jgi:predicted ferric reductase
MATDRLQWKAYEDAAVPLIPQIRWYLLNPLQFRVPKTGFTFGEALMMFLTILFFVVNAAAMTDAESSGGLACVPFALAFATAAHNSIFTFIFGLPFERALFWHKYFAIWSFILGTTHGIAAGMGDGEAMSGLVATVIAALMLFAFYPPLRRKTFELFYYLHWFMFIIMLFALLIHEAGAVTFGAGLWIIDIGIRYIWMASLKHGHEATIEALPADVIKISIPRKDFNYRAGQYCFICIPELSMFEWHPFSISTSPHTDNGNFTLHVRALGDWTNAFKKLAVKKQNIRILYEGPYGEPQIDFEGDKYKLFLLVSGGIGITPMQSICNQLHDEHNRGRPIELCYFVWTCRDKYMVDSVTMSPLNDKEQQEGGSGGGGGGGYRRNGLPISFQPDIINAMGLSKYVTMISRTISPQPLVSVGSKDNDKAEDDYDAMKQSNSFHTEYYLTQAKKETDLEGIHTNTKYNLKMGRPNIEHIFATMKTVAIEKGINRVAVLTCGPPSLVKSVVLQADLHSTIGGVRFDTHVETFEF